MEDTPSWSDVLESETRTVAGARRLMHVPILTIGKSLSCFIENYKIHKDPTASKSVFSSDRCVNDPETGLVSQAFGRLASYEWRKEEGCVAVCPSTEETCTRGEKIIKYLKVYPTIQESRRDVVNCTYTGVWRRDGPISQNVTGQYLQQGAPHPPPPN